MCIPSNSEEFIPRALSHDLSRVHAFSHKNFMSLILKHSLHVKPECVTIFIHKWSTMQIDSSQVAEYTITEVGLQVI